MRSFRRLGTIPWVQKAVGVVAAEMPDVIVALADPAFDGVLQIDPAKRMFPGHPRDHAKIEAPPGVTAGANPCCPPDDSCVCRAVPCRGDTTERKL